MHFLSVVACSDYPETIFFFFLHGSWGFSKMRMFQAIFCKSCASNMHNRFCGFTGIYFHVQEIMPSAVGVHRFNADSQPVTTFDPAVEVRAVIEGQCLAKRLHAEQLGYNIGESCFDAFCQFELELLNIYGFHIT